MRFMQISRYVLTLIHEYRETVRFCIIEDLYWTQMFKNIS